MKRVITILTVLAVLSICSCNGSKSSEYAYTCMTDIAEASWQSDEQKTDNLESTTERKIVKRGNIRFQTADINKTKSLISQTVQELNGYISNDNAYDYSDRFEHNLTIRVPADKFDMLLKNVSESVEKLDSKNIDVLDVTEEYIDIEARIKTKKELQDRYKEILKKATTVSEILTVEREIGSLQTDIESVEGRMKFLKDEIKFSTLTVTYYQKVTTSSSLGFFFELRDGFKSGWNGFLWFIIGVSYLWVFILVAVAVIYLIVRWRRKKRKMNNNKQINKNNN